MMTSLVGNNGKNILDGGEGSDTLEAEMELTYLLLRRLMTVLTWT